MYLVGNNTPNSLGNLNIANSTESLKTHISKERELKIKSFEFYICSKEQRGGLSEIVIL